MIETTRNCKLAAHVHQLFNEGRVDEIVACTTDDIVVDLVPMGQVFRGQQEMRTFLQLFLGAFPDIAITHTHARETSDGAVVEFTWRGTHRGPLHTPAGAVPPTGKAIEGARVCEVFTMRDGKITAIRNYQDVASWLRQLGLA